jgi:dihydrofolate reductase
MKVVWHITMSVDGFIAGPGDSMEWAFRRGQSAPTMAIDVMRSTGAILGGRRWFDVASSKYRGVAGIYGGVWRGPVLVLTHRMERSPAPALTFISEPIAAAVVKARETAAGKNVGIFGANVAQQCLRAGLVDEIVIHHAPVLLGDGVRLYGPSMPEIELERIETAESGQIVDVRYRVTK